MNDGVRGGEWWWVCYALALGSVCLRAIVSRDPYISQSPFVDGTEVIQFMPRSAVRAFARQRLRRVGLVGIPRTEIDGWRERQQRDRTLGSRGSDALVRLSDVLAYAAEYRAHTPHGVMP